jgi:hypothetical protein
MWGAAVSAIYSISELLWVGYVLLFMWLLVKNSKDLSAVMSVGCWCITDLASLALTPILYAAIVNGALPSESWYASFIVLNAFSAVLLLAAHNWVGINISKLASCVIGFLLILSAIHAIRCVDRSMHDALAMFYRYSVMSLKILALFSLAKLVSNTTRSSSGYFN